MKRLLAAGVAAVLIVGVSIPTIATARSKAAKHHQAAQKDRWAVCREHPILHISPPLVLDSSHAATFNISDVLESCTSSDPSISRGIAYINATSPSASCQFGTVDGVARIRWNNGRTSRVDFQGVFAAGFVHTTTGNVSGGSEFVGDPFAALDHLNVDAIALQLCSTPSFGLSTLASDGVISIGNPPTSDGVVWTP
jgi:hypothetical protein